MARKLASWKSFLHDTPGRRFVHRYDQLGGRGRRSAWRMARSLLGAVLVLVGVAFMALPGPGIVPALAGLALMAGESIIMATWLDRAELKVRNWWGRG